MEQPCPLPSAKPLKKRIDTMINPRRILCADFDEKAFHGETQIKCDNIG